MHRVLVALLSAFDAVIAAAAAIAAVLAALTVLWVFGIGQPDWGALWPAAASIWQLGNLVPLHVALPEGYLVQAGVDASAASFTLSLAPLAFAAFTAIFAARSGARAAGAGTWGTGLAGGALAFAAIAAGIALTAGNAVTHVVLWQAVLFPVLLHTLSALVGAVTTAWRDGDDGPIDRLHDRVDGWRGGWAAVPGLAVRGTAAALTGLVGLGALVLAMALIVRGGQIIALYEAGGVDALSASLLTAGQLTYLPTLVVWAVSWVAGPGFALGPGTAVSPAGTQIGVLPGIPILGVVPESASPLLLLVLLLPIGVGALAGWVARSRLVAEHGDAAGPRVVLTALIAVLSGAGAALLAFLASGSAGPGRLAAVGPAPGPVALAVGMEVLVGAGILLLSPRRADESARRMDDALGEVGTGMTAPGRRAGAPDSTDPAPTAPVDPLPSGAWDLDSDHETAPID